MRDPDPTSKARRGRAVDLVVDLTATVLLLGVLTAVVACASLVGALAAGVTDDGRACGARCLGRVELGAHVGAVGPWAWWGLTWVVVAVRVVRRRTSWWVPLAAAPLVVLTVVVARALALSGPAR